MHGEQGPARMEYMSCEDGSLHSLPLEARTHTCALPALWECIYKLNERDNRCFHIISQRIE